MSDGLLFPKQGKKKRRQIHAKCSILQKDIDRSRCWLCMSLNHDYSEHTRGSLHKHHVFMGPLRGISEAEGFFVWLCPQHHEFGEYAVHRNHKTCLQIQQQMQAEFEKKHTREEFIRLIGRSYL